MGNKLSSEDRLRYVQQLIKTSEVILARRQQEEEAAAAANEILLDGRSIIENKCEYKDPTLEAHRYQHYLLLPSFVDNNNNRTSRSLAGATEPYCWNNVVQEPIAPNFMNYHPSYSTDSSTIYSTWNYYQS